MNTNGNPKCTIILLTNEIHLVNMVMLGSKLTCTFLLCLWTLLLGASVGLWSLDGKQMLGKECHDMAFTCHCSYSVLKWFKYIF